MEKLASQACNKFWKKEKKKQKKEEKINDVTSFVDGITRLCKSLQLLIYKSTFKSCESLVLKIWKIASGKNSFLSDAKLYIVCVLLYWQKVFDWYVWI